MKKLILLPATVLFSIAFSASAEVNFEKDVLPLLEEKCMGCHREAYTDPKRGRLKKPKSGYRMDTADLIKGAGDENKANIVPGDAEKSPVYKYTTLTEDDDWVMPTKGDLLTKAQQETLKNWINEGATFGSWKVTKFTPEGDKVK